MSALLAYLQHAFSSARPPGWTASAEVSTLTAISLNCLAIGHKLGSLVSLRCRCSRLCDALEANRLVRKQVLRLVKIYSHKRPLVRFCAYCMV